MRSRAHKDAQKHDTPSDRRDSNKTRTNASKRMILTVDGKKLCTAWKTPPRSENARVAYNDKPPLTSEFNIGRAARDGRLLLDQARRARTKKSSPTTAPTGDINIESGDGKGERGEREGSTNERRRSTAKNGESTRSGAKFCPSTVPQNKCGVMCEGRGAHMEEVGQPHAAVEERTTCVWNEGHGGGR